MSDFVINAKARAVLTRHWIETETLSVSAVNGTLFVRGRIRFRPARERQQGELKADMLIVIDRELRTIPHVRRVQFQLENWQRDDAGGWIRTDVRAARKAGPAPGSAGATAKAAAGEEFGGGEEGAGGEGEAGGAVGAGPDE